MNPGPDGASEHPVILFDGVCNLCNHSVAFVIRHDPRGRFRFASLQSPTGQALLRRHGMDAANVFSVILVDGGRAFSRSPAAIRIAAELSGVWRLGAALWVIPRPVRDWMYEVVARNRYRWFGRRDACMMPTPELRARFLG
jgi:predicted DCC family thiol-disulfide oxidoreductase YuxK